MPSANDATERIQLPDVLQFMRLVWALTHQLERLSKRMTRDLGVTGPQRLALRVIGLFPGISAGQLADVLHIHPSTLTGILQRLRAQELIARVEHRADRRRAVLRLTPRGLRANRETQGTVEAAIARALAAAPDGDRAAARRMLSRVREQLDRETAGAGRRQLRAAARGRRQRPSVAPRTRT